MRQNCSLPAKLVRALIVLSLLILFSGNVFAQSTDDDDDDFFGMFLTTVGATSIGSLQLTKRVVLGREDYPKEDQKSAEFLESNYEDIRHVLAVGEGEHARSLAALLSVEPSDVSLFLFYGKENYGGLYPPEKDVRSVLAELKGLASMSSPGREAFTKPGYLISEASINEMFRGSGKAIFSPLGLPTWRPSKEDIQELESRLFSYLENLPQKTNRILAQNLRGYGRQYLPFTTAEGEQVILVNAFCSSLGQKEEVLRTQLFEVDDGGLCFFRVEFDPKTHRFRNYRSNGEA